MAKPDSKSTKPAKASAKAVKTPTWPAYTVKRWLISKLKPYDRNARTHPEKQIAQLRASLQKYGWTMPLLVREDGIIIAGHGRLEAAIQEGYKHAPVIIATGWSEQQCREYTLADNRIALNSGWDGKMLGAELNELRDLGLDLKAIGFSDSELNRFNPLTEGSPELELKAVFQILIECADEAEQLKLLTTLQADGTKCRALIA